MKNEKIVYKTNKKMLKRLIISILIILLVIILTPFAINGTRNLYLNSWTWHKIEEYNFSIKLPRAYKNIEVENKSYGIDSSILNAEVSIEENEEYIQKAPEVVYNAGNILNGVGLTIQCLKTAKTSKTLDEIADSHHVLVSINYDDQYEIGDLQKEYVKILENDAVMTSIDMKKGKTTKTLIAYLVPLKDKEITIMFFGNKENISKSMDEIKEIVSKIK